MNPAPPRGGPAWVSAGSALRQRAMTALREDAAQPPQNAALPWPVAAQEMLHELRVHQIELEMQNEDLRRAQAALDTAHSRYFDLYDLAPVGYVSLSAAGLILQSNRAASALLGASPNELANQQISRFIFRDDQDSDYPVSYTHLTLPTILRV